VLKARAMPPKVARALDPGTVAGSLGLAVLAGLAVPQHTGLLVPLVAVALMAVLAEAHARRVAKLVAAGVSRSLSTQPLARRFALALTLSLPTVVIATVAARGVSSIVVAYPAAIWGLMAAAFGGLVLAILPVGAGRWLLATAFAISVPVAGVAGERWEAAGVGAQGWAATGQLLGIHPFQTTAVMVDGHGPHDIPVNDYFEPDGSRGYGPDEIAAALQHAIRSIGREHYADGPAAARMAFENVRVVAMSTAPLRESLDRTPVETLSTRMMFFSGTTGQRSRIQFVCPGQREDPRGAMPDLVTKPMCPSKYITEASAGLSVTGRWTGYTEARGQERFGLARQWLGGTRTDGPAGAVVIEREIRWGAWLLVAGLALASISRRENGASQEGLSAVAGAVGILGLLVGIWAVASTSGMPAVGWIETPPSWASFDIRAWTPVLAIGAVVVATLGPGQGGRTFGRGAVRLGAVPLALGVFACASQLRATQWVTPDLYTQGGALAFERWIGGAANALWEADFGYASWTPQVMEAAVASCMAVVLAGSALAMLCSLGTSIDPPRGARGRQWVRASAVVAVAITVACMVISRKTAGASALVPAAMGILVVHGSCMGLTAAGRRPKPTALGIHIGLILLGVWLVFASTAELPSVPFVIVCTAAGLVACASALAFVLPDTSTTETDGLTPSGDSAEPQPATPPTPVPPETTSPPAEPDA